MHTRGRSRDMYERAVYEDAASDVAAELAEAVTRAERAGVARDAIIVDPGLGFAKRAEHSFDVLAQLDRDRRARPADSVAALRKSFLKAALGDRPTDEREWGTAAAVAASILFGAHIVRVHNVRAMVDVARVADRIRAAGHEPPVAP